MIDRKRAPVGAQKKFIEDALVSKTDRCIVWPFSIDKDGYGNTRWEGKRIRAHIVVLTLTAGPRPKKHFACHAPVICHNSSCINPKHLRWATEKENKADQIKDNTSKRGERHHNAKLDRYQVRQIRRSTRRASYLAEDYNISEGYVRSIRRGGSWAWLK